MIMPERLDVELIEKEVLTVELIEQETIEVNLVTVDIIKDRSWVIVTINEILTINETPTKLTVKRFRTAYTYLSGSLKVYLNGIKEKYITEISDTDFEFEINTVLDDDIEVEYIKTE